MKEAPFRYSMMTALTVTTIVAVGAALETRFGIMMRLFRFLYGSEFSWVLGILGMFGTWMLIVLSGGVYWYFADRRKGR
jgi:hypothetical protein